MQTKYTPGPWKSEGCCVKNADDKIVVACILGSVNRDNEHEDYATARLIAEAPEMAELLRELRDYVSCIPESAAGGDDVAIALTRKADALLARIEGGAE